MKRNIIWVTGPAASGKTWILNELAGYIKTNAILSDAAELLDLNEQDIHHKHHIHPSSTEAFEITSTYPFDEAVRRICMKLLTLNDETVFVELARGKGDRHDIDVSYTRLLDLIPQRVFERSFFVYVQANYETRITRNAKRRKTDYARNVTQESFYTPVEAMRGFFKHDDFQAVQHLIPCPVYTLDNRSASKDELRKDIRRLAKMLI